MPLSNTYFSLNICLRASVNWYLHVFDNSENVLGYPKPQTIMNSCIYFLSFHVVYILRFKHRTDPSRNAARPFALRFLLRCCSCWVRVGCGLPRVHFLGNELRFARHFPKRNEQIRMAAKGERPVVRPPPSRRRDRVQATFISIWPTANATTTVRHCQPLDRETFPRLWLYCSWLHLLNIIIIEKMSNNCR